MRKITLIIIHCSAVGPDQTSSAAQIDQWHRQQGYANGIGYHYVVRRDGTIEPGRPEELVGAHCKNHNRHSIGVCYEGGLKASPPTLLSEGGGGSKSTTRYMPADTRTNAQKAAMLQLLKELKTRYPKAIIVGHHDLNPQKACPCFDATKEYSQLKG